MDSALWVVVSVTIAVNAWIVVADLRRSPFVLANSAEVGVDARWLPVLAALKGAGVLGLLLGLLGFRTIGIVAAAGLVLFFVGALTAHVRKRVFYNLAFPAGFFALALGSLWLLAAG